MPPFNNLVNAPVLRGRGWLEILHRPAATPAITGVDNMARVYWKTDGRGYYITGSAGAAITLVGDTTTDTLTNKTLTSPVLTTPQINDASADHQYVFAVSELAADRTVTLPLLTGDDTFVFQAHAQTLTNKTLTSPTINGTVATTGLTLPAHTSGAIDMNATAISNIGAGGTDFSATGGLTLADALVVSSGGGQIKGAATAPGADTANINGTLILAGGSNAGANDTGVQLLFYRTSTQLGFFGYDSDTTSVAGVATTAADPKFGFAGTLRAAFDATDNYRLLLAAGLTVTPDVNIGVAGTTLGVLKLSGNTSGTVTINTAAAAGTWTFTLPPDDGDAGEQLQTNGSGVTTWEAAASLRAFKDIRGTLDPQMALSRILAAPVSLFHYKRSTPGRRITSTGDYDTLYAGVMADEAPWAMHHRGRIFSPVSAAGHAFAAIQALAMKVDALAAKVGAI